MFLDTNGDGVKNRNENVVPGALVTILLPDGRKMTVVTDKNGRYSVPAELPEGSYTVLVQVPGDDAAPRIGNITVSGNDFALDIPLVDSALALTGSQTTTHALWALMLILTGFGLIFATRRREEEEQADTAR